MAFPSSTAAPLVRHAPSHILNSVPLNEAEDNNSVERRLEALQRTRLPNSPMLSAIGGTAYDSPERILFAKRPMTLANLSFPEDLPSDELRKRQRLAHRVVMTQRNNPPALPPTNIPELAEKKLIDESNLSGAHRAAEITDINRKRNNMAAMRGRQVKDEKLFNGENMRILGFARTTWLEMRLATLGVDAAQEWAAVSDDFKVELQMEIWSGITGIYDERDQERKVWVSDRRKQKGARLAKLKEENEKKKREQATGEGATGEGATGEAATGEEATGEEATGEGTDGKKKRRGRRQTEEDKEYELWQQQEDGEESHLPSMPMSDTGLESESAQTGRSHSFDLAPLQAAVMATPMTTEPNMFTSSTMDLVHGGSQHHHHYQYHAFDGGLHHHGYSSQGLDFGMGQPQQQQQTVATAA